MYIMFQTKFIKSILFAVLLTASTSSFASFYLAPSAGYSQHTIKSTDAFSSTEVETKIESPIFGLSLGYQTIMGVTASLNGAYQTGKAKSTISGSGTVESDIEHKKVSAQLGLNALSSFKLYLGYIVMNELTVKSQTPGNNQIYTGGGYLAGIEMVLTPSITLGVQYDLNQFQKIKSENTGNEVDVKTNFSKFDSQSLSAMLKIYF